MWQLYSSCGPVASLPATLHHCRTKLQNLLLSYWVEVIKMFVKFSSGRNLNFISVFYDIFLLKKIHSTFQFTSNVFHEFEIRTLRL